MFVLIAIKDTIAVAPTAFELPQGTVIVDALNKKFANKLVPEKGLALSVYDVLTAEDGKVTWGNGMMYYKVSFRLMLFAPFIGEVITGKIISTSKSYIRVSIDFFRDIYIVPSLLPPNSIYDPTEKKYFWVLTDDETPMTPQEMLNTVLSERLYIDEGESIRVRVDSVHWQDVRPTPPPVYNQAGEIESTTPEKDPIDKAGFKILASIAESGLGVISWWSQGGEEEEAVAEEGEEGSGEYTEYAEGEGEQGEEYQGQEQEWAEQ